MGPMAAGQPDVPTTSICYKCNKPCDSDTLRCHITAGCNSVQKQREVAEEIIKTGTAAAIMRESALKKMDAMYEERMRNQEELDAHMSEHEKALEKFLKSKGVAVAKKSPLVKVLEKYEHTPVETFPPQDFYYDDPFLKSAQAINPYIGGSAGGSDPWGGSPMNIPVNVPNGAGGGAIAIGGGGGGPITVRNLPVNEPKKSPFVTLVVQDGQYYNLSEAGITIMNKSGKRLKFIVEEP